MGALRRDRERDRARGAHAHDRRGLRRPHAGARLGLRRQRPREHLAARRLARQRRVADVTGRVFEVEGGMISVADGWQHGPQRRQGRALGARPRSAPRCASCSRKAPATRTGLRRAVNRAHPAPADDPGALARAARLDRRDAARPARRASTARTLAIVDGDVRLTVDDLRARSAGSRPRCANAACSPATWSRGSCRTGGKRSCCAGRSGGAARSRARSRRRSARARSVSSCAQTRRASIVVPQTFRGTDYPALRPRRRIRRRRCSSVRGDASRCPRARHRCRRDDASVDDPAVDPLDVGHDLGPEGRRAHAPVAARRGRHDRRRARDARRASRCCCRCRSRTSPGSRTACCCRSRSAITAVLMDMWEPGPRARARRTRTHRGDDQHAGVHAHDDRPPRVRRDRHARRCGCSRSAARASRPRWCARARAAFGLLVQAHVRLDRVPDAHDRPARRRPRARRDHRRPSDRRAPSSASSTRRRSSTCRPARRASCSRADPRCSSATSTARSTPTRSSTDGWFRTGDLAVYDGDVPDDRRPAEGHHHPRRREHLGAGGRGAARHASRRRGSRVRRRARSGDGREGVRVRDRGTGRGADARRAPRASRSSTGLARFKLPERLEVRDDLPRTASGKVQKAPLRAELRTVGRRRGAGWMTSRTGSAPS